MSCLVVVPPQTFSPCRMSSWEVSKVDGELQAVVLVARDMRERIRADAEVQAEKNKLAAVIGLLAQA